MNKIPIIYFGFQRSPKTGYFTFESVQIGAHFQILAHLFYPGKSWQGKFFTTYITLQQCACRTFDNIYIRVSQNVQTGKLMLATSFSG